MMKQLNFWKLSMQRGTYLFNIMIGINIAYYTVIMGAMGQLR